MQWDSYHGLLNSEPKDNYPTKTMDFELSEEQTLFVETAREFARREFAPHAADWDRDQYFPKEVIRSAGELGFCSLYTAEEFGGQGLSRLDSSLIIEELAQGCTSTTAYITIHNMALWMLTHFGTEEACREWCDGLVTGEQLLSYCLTEPGSGSDAAAMKTKAESVNGGFRITGTKAFISGAGSTDALVVMARQDDGQIGCFLVPGDARGISYGRKEDKMGWNSQPTAQINFDQVSVPGHYRIGEPGEGFKIAMGGLDGGRINIGTCSIGTAQSALTRTAEWMRDRKQFGKPLADFQALQFKLADMATDLVAARQMIRYAAFKLDNAHADATLYCAMAKRFATDAGYKICDEALQLHGGYGYMKEYPLERHVRDLRVHRILEGTNEIMRLIISRRVLMEGATEIIR